MIIPSHRVISCNRSANKAILLKHNDLGHNLLRRPFNFAPPEVQGDHYQLGPQALGQYLQRKNIKALSQGKLQPLKRCLAAGAGSARRVVHPATAEAYHATPCGDGAHHDGVGPEDGIPGSDRPRPVLVLRAAGHRATHGIAYPVCT